MLVCVCNSITDSQIRAAVRAGAADRRDIARACGYAGQGCGSCLRAIDALIVEETASPPAGDDQAEDGGLLAAG